MDWRAVQFDWNRARAFLVTAEEGTFSAAARALGSSQPTVGRQVAALEEELGVTLFERTGDGLVLTAAGLELLEHVGAMGRAAGQVSLVATGQSAAIDGPVCISASEVFAAHVLPPVLAAIRSRYPGIALEIVATNAVSDLQRREADIAVRNFRPNQPNLVTRRVRDAVGHLYATPAYLASLGGPRTPADFADAVFVSFDRGPAMLEGLRAIGLPVTERSFAVVCANQLVQWALVKQGAGIGVMIAEVGDIEPAVVRILPDLPPFPAPIWLTTHREVHTSRRIRVVFDLLVEGLGEPPVAG